MRRLSTDCPRPRPRRPPPVLLPLLHALLVLAAAVLVLVLGAAAVVEGPPPPPIGLHLQRAVPSAAVARTVERLVSRWAPLVWLSPGERFMPAGVEDFLKHVTPRAMVEGQGRGAGRVAGRPSSRAGRSSTGVSTGTSQAAANAVPAIPQGPRSAAWYLVSNASVEELLGNSSSFLYGHDPSRGPVPVYAVVTLCDERRLGLRGLRELRASERARSRGGRGLGPERPERTPGPGASPDAVPDRPDHPDAEDELLDNEVPAGPADPEPLLHVTYWMFFPYNEGKPVCVLDLGPLGPWPLPLLWGSCMGTWRRFGAHVGDWEHVSLFFSKESHPDAMYVSAHEAGAFYRWSGAAPGVAGVAGAAPGHLVLERQEVRKGSELLQRASFPPLARLHRATGRPELFAAQGSHGLWTRPGSHRYVRVPRLYDHSGYGAPWRTWERLAVLYEGSPTAAGWLRFLGRWGNPRAGCHPLSAAICTQADGPTGIPLKGRPFSCPAPNAPKAAKAMAKAAQARPSRRLPAKPRR